MKKNNLFSIKNAGDIKGKTVLLRIDTNVPLCGGKVVDDYRLKRVAPTLEFLKKAGASTIILGHHGGNDNKQSLFPVAKYLGVKLLPLNINEKPKLKSGEVVMLENLRLDPGEMANYKSFAKKLAGFGDVYVNDAFAESHRPVASIVGLPNFLPSYFGFLFADEVENLSKAFNAPHPFILILGGAKFSTKVPLVKKLLKVADKIFIGGALSNTFFKNAGYEIGLSRFDEKPLDTETLRKNPKIFLPEDAIVTDAKGKRAVRSINSILPTDSMMDNGQNFLKEIELALNGSKFVLWNGPLGIFEKGFTENTEELARAIVASGAQTIVGGGDTLASIKKCDLMDKFSFVSTGGGAMLEFLAEGTLAGIKAVK
ncbi:MAG: phosphoglycerate kinase [Candidatus Paceibacterota bacterium]|jgi:phosphoglycerate kinase